jgi:hypothetical protein
MAAFLRGKGQIFWDVMVNIAYVHPINFLAPGSWDMQVPTTRRHDLCQFEFDRVQTQDLACRIWEQLKNAHAGNAHVQTWFALPKLLDVM